MHRGAIAIRALALIAFCPSLVFAQASITGSVRDMSGALLPGVSVDAISPALIEKTRSVVTDNTGQYRIEGLRPGTYTVEFTLPGFSTVHREGVALEGSFTATINAELRVGGLEETITVTGATPTVDVQNTTQQRVIDHEVVDTLPTGRSDRALGALIPGVTGGQDSGGALTAASGIQIHGSTGGTIMQSGVAITSGFGDSSNSQAVPNMVAFQEITYDTSAASAEMATGGVRINFVPKDGGNTFNGSWFGSFANHSMQGNNYSKAPIQLKRMWDVNPGFGGPIHKDTLWFYASARYFSVGIYPAGAAFNANANKPTVWTYAPDASGERPSNESVFKDLTARVTWQASAKHKISMTWTEQPQCLCPELVGATVAPEAAQLRVFKIRNVVFDWSAPVTSRMLLEAAAIPHRIQRVTRRLSPLSSAPMVSVVDQGLGNLVYRAPQGTNNAPGPLRNTDYFTSFYRVAESYITGAHAFKMGLTYDNSSDPTTSFAATQPYNFRFNNGVPNQVTLFATPSVVEFNNTSLGMFLQDKWTAGRLTVNYGLRFDFYQTSYPEQLLGPGPLVPTRNVRLPKTLGVNWWKDVSPKSGAVYDLFGNGKTALKVSLNKYLQTGGDGGPFGLALAPANLIVQTTTRNWTDANGNFVPDCDLTNPAVQDNRAGGGDLCAASANPNFGLPVRGSTYDPDTLAGWGKRSFNWEFSTSVQQELAPRVALSLGYFRRWYGNFVVTDDRAVTAGDYDRFSVSAPADAQLANAGAKVDGIFNLKPAAFGRPSDNYVTFASNYGTQIQHWNGVDLTVNARPRDGVFLQGGMSTGRTSTDNCEVAAKLPSVLLAGSVWTPMQYCHQDTKFVTQVKLVGTYTVPKVDLLLSAVLQSLPGPSIQANWVASNAAIAGSLGRSLSGGAQNITVALLTPGAAYSDRSNVVDWRLGKFLRVAGARTLVSLDLYNLFNSSAVLTQNNAFGGTTRWLTPQSIQLARYGKVSAQIDF